jgi:uncharacterized protein YbjT (DUF2867 family)
MTVPILVTGGTGTLGRRLVPRLAAAGCAVRVLTRRDRPDPDPDSGGVTYLTGDLATGTGLGPALDGVGTVVHCAGGPKGDDELTRTLVRAMPRTAHLVFISVVGVDRIPLASRLDRAMFGYYGSKLAAERVVADSGLPWTTLRATQFHDLILMVARLLAKLPVVPVPAGFAFQPVDTDEVAARLVELAVGTPAGLVPEMGGPVAYPAVELVRGYLRATGRRRALLPVRVPGRAAAALRAGANLTPAHAVGRRTWEEFLAERVGRTG